MAKESLLEAQLAQVWEVSKNTGVEVIEGVLNEPNKSFGVLCKTTDVGDFIRQAKKLGAVAIVLDTSRLDQAAIIQAREALEDAEPSQTKADLQKVIDGSENR